MTAQEIVQTIEAQRAVVLNRIEDAYMAVISLDGSDSPAADAIIAMRDYRDGLVYGTFEDALDGLINHGAVPEGVADFDPSQWDEGDGPSAKRQHLLAEFGGVLFTVLGAVPLAYIGRPGETFHLLTDLETAESVRAMVDAFFDEDAFEDGADDDDWADDE